MEKSAVPLNSALRGTSARCSGWDPAPTKAELIPKPFKSDFSSVSSQPTPKIHCRGSRSFFLPLSSLPHNLPIFSFPDPNRCFLNPNPGWTKGWFNRGQNNRRNQKRRRTQPHCGGSALVLEGRDPRMPCF